MIFCLYIAITFFRFIIFFFKSFYYLFFNLNFLFVLERSYLSRNLFWFEHLISIITSFSLLLIFLKL